MPAATDLLTHSTILAAIRNLEQAGLLTYRAFSDDWIIQLRRGDATRHILGYMFDLNSQVAAAIATDKVGTYELLHASGVAAVPHVLLTAPTMPQPDESLIQNLLACEHALVVKPTQGSRGRDVYLCTDTAMVQKLVGRTDISSWTASPWVDITRELRLVLLNGEVGVAYEKFDPVTVNGVRMFNLNLGAHARRVAPDSLEPALQQLAANAMQAIGLDLGAVDVVFDAEGTPSVLEINSGFSIEHFAAMKPAHYQEAVAFYERLIRGLFTSSDRS